jgi:hypothetical protein
MSAGTAPTGGPLPAPGPLRAEPRPEIAEDTGAATPPTAICCGQRLTFTTVMREGGFGFTYCDRCESMRWFRGGLPVAGAVT